ncbi:hypothetical protein [Taklimakanibacter deserti]|uniref:hypothetical protein n=1 Tax=Taklimakanibacter deserti TaxID=2267839 RepID=UPI000E658D34
MHLTDVSAEDSRQLLAAPNAMSIVALERQNLHEKIVRLRALREAAGAEAEKGLTDEKVSVRRR